MRKARKRSEQISSAVERMSLNDQYLRQHKMSHTTCCLSTEDYCTGTSKEMYLYMWSPGKDSAYSHLNVPYELRDTLLTAVVTDLQAKGYGFTPNPEAREDDNPSGYLKPPEGMDAEQVWKDLVEASNAHSKPVTDHQPPAKKRGGRQRGSGMAR